MENASRREKFLFWLIKNSHKPWLVVSVLIAAVILTNTGMGGLIGLGVSIWGALAFAAGINLALEATLGADYTQKGVWKKNAKDN